MLSKIYNWLTGGLTETFKFIVTFYAKAFNPLVAITLAGYEVLQWLFKAFTGQELEIGKLGQHYATFKQAVGTYVFGSFPPQVEALFSVVNYIVPVTETLVMVGLLCLFYSAAVAFRVLKSWLPTVN